MSTINTKLIDLLEESNNRAFVLLELGKIVEDRLRHSDYLELRNVSCDFHEGVLTLRGRVPSYHLKQLAQAIVSEFDGVFQLNNYLEVVQFGEVGQSNYRPTNTESRPRRYV
jgi:osmotically-inducible protein OsmY